MKIQAAEPQAAEPQAAEPQAAEPNGKSRLLSDGRRRLWGLIGTLVASSVLLAVGVSQAQQPHSGLIAEANCASAPTLPGAGHTLNATGGTFSIPITAGTGCAWGAAITIQDTSWLSASSSYSGGNSSGSGTLTITTTASPSLSTRMQTITVSGVAYLVVQAGLYKNSLVFGNYPSGAYVDPQFTVYRPSTQTWYAFSPGSSNSLITQWGGAGDLPVNRSQSLLIDSIFLYLTYPQTGPLVFRPSNGQWYDAYKTTAPIQWGQAGDVPLGGPFSGALFGYDLAVFRPTNGNWYIYSPTFNNTHTVNWGQSGDIPVPGNYLGYDYSLNLAVYRPSTSVWYITSLNTFAKGSFQQGFGSPGDIPVPADYDGDGVTDIAVWRPSNGTFYVLQSSTGNLVSQQLGSDGDIPTPITNGSKYQYGVYRPSTGRLFILSGSTINSYGWGQSGDIPI